MSSGKVVAVSDGDAIGVLCDGREVKVRFQRIDAPEIGRHAVLARMVKGELKHSPVSPSASLW